MSVESSDGGTQGSDINRTQVVTNEISTSTVEQMGQGSVADIEARPCGMGAALDDGRCRRRCRKALAVVPVIRANTGETRVSNACDMVRPPSTDEGSIVTQRNGPVALG